MSLNPKVLFRTPSAYGKGLTSVSQHLDTDPQNVDHVTVSEFLFFRFVAKSKRLR